MLPDGIEEIDPGEAAAFRNRWMLHRADYVVTYPRSGKEAAGLVEEVRNEGKRIIRLV